MSGKSENDRGATVAAVAGVSTTMVPENGLRGKLVLLALGNLR